MYSFMGDKEKIDPMLHCYTCYNVTQWGRACEKVLKASTDSSSLIDIRYICKSL